MILSQGFPLLTDNECCIKALDAARRLKNEEESDGSQIIKRFRIRLEYYCIIFICAFSSFWCVQVIRNGRSAGALDPLWSHITEVITVIA